MDPGEGNAEPSFGNTADPPASVVYVEDEELPEIEITELLSLDEILAHEPAFIAMTDQEIRGHMASFAQDPRSAHAFTRLHMDVVRQLQEKARRVPRLPVDRVPVLGSTSLAPRKGEFAGAREWIDRMAADDNAPYPLRMQIREEYSIPFETGRPVEEPWDFPERTTPDTTQRRTVILDTEAVAALGPSPNERSRFEITALSHAPPVSTSEDMLVDRVAAESQPAAHLPVAEIIRGPGTPLAELFQASRVPLPAILEHLPGPAIPEGMLLHDLRRVLAQYGYLWEDLDPDATEALAEALAASPAAEAAPAAPASPRAATSPAAPAPYAPFAPTVDAALAALKALPLDQFQERLGQIGQTIPAPAPDAERIPPYEILRRVASGEMGVEDARAMVRARIDAYALGIMEQWLTTAMATDPDAIDGLVRHWRAAVDILGGAYQDAGPIERTHIDIPRTMVEAPTLGPEFVSEKEGEFKERDPDDPDGDSEEPIDYGDEDDRAELEPNTNNNTMFELIQEVAAEQDVPPDSAPFPQAIPSAHPLYAAAQEVWPRLARLASITSMPLESDAWARYVVSMPPGANDDPTLWIASIGWWGMGLLERVMVQGAGSVLMESNKWNPDWSPLGPPVETDRSKRNMGIFPFLGQMAPMSSKELDRVYIWIEANYPAELAAMRTKATAFFRNEPLRNRANDAYNALKAESKNKNKDRALRISLYLRALSMLPIILANRDPIHQDPGFFGTRVLAWAPRSCCFQKIDARFQADQDLTELLRKAKVYFATKHYDIKRSRIPMFRPVGAEGARVVPPPPAPNVPVPIGPPVAAGPMQPALPWHGHDDVWTRFFTEADANAMYENHNNAIQAIQTALHAGQIALPMLPDVQIPLLEAIFHSVGPVLYQERANTVEDQDAMEAALVAWQHMRDLWRLVPSTEIYRPVLGVITARALLLPAYLDGGMPRMPPGVSHDLRTRVRNKVQRRARAIVDTSRLLTPEEQHETITKIREKMKVEKTNYMDAFDADTRQMMRNASELGVFVYPIGPNAPGAGAAAAAAPGAEAPDEDSA